MYSNVGQNRSSSRLVFFNRSPYVTCISLPCVINDNVDIVFIEIYCILKVIFLKNNPFCCKETFISTM